jgi:hypothetical protein
MKKLLTLLVIALCATSIGYAQFFGSEVKDVSLRLEGMSPEFAGLIDDEYTDIWVNPADILNVKGGRLYTNLSNYVTGEETQFGGASADEYLIGGIYSWENIGTFGAFFRNSYWKYEVDDVTIDEYKSFAIPLLYGRQINDELAFGVKVGYQKEETESWKQDAFIVAPGIKYVISPELTIGGIAKIGMENYKSGAADDDGFIWGLGVQAWYQLNDANKMRGIIAYENSKIDDADVKETGWMIGVGNETKLNEKLMLALGIKYGDSKYEETGYEDTESGFALPVGLEYTMTDWLAFRIGATHWIWTDKTEGEGTSEETGSETDYYYGAGLNITENLTVDVLGWSNLTDLDNWKLSATVKF